MAKNSPITIFLFRFVFRCSSGVLDGFSFTVSSLSGFGVFMIVSFSGTGTGTGSISTVSLGFHLKYSKQDTSKSARQIAVITHKKTVDLKGIEMRIANIKTTIQKMAEINDLR